MKESIFQKHIKDRLKKEFPGSIVLKNDPTFLQGVPDLIVLWDYKWAALEVKANQRSPMRPNQYYYISRMNEMSFSTVICPENEEEVLGELSYFFRKDA